MTLAICRRTHFPLLNALLYSYATLASAALYVLQPFNQRYSRYYYAVPEPIVALAIQTCTDQTLALTIVLVIQSRTTLHFSPYIQTVNLYCVLTLNKVYFKP